MQEFDALRHRVEETARKLNAVQTERHDQTQSLVDILRRLEERHAAQEQQLTYYMQRLAPLEQANQQLVGLMENLLDLIDRGFGDDSLEPLRRASDMASSMLANDLFLPEAAPAAVEEKQPREDSATAEYPDAVADDVAPPEFGPDDDADEIGAADIEGENAAEPAVAGMQVDDEDDDEFLVNENTDGVDDLEMEEDALISLDDLLELASDDSAGRPVSFEGDAPSEAVAEEAMPAAAAQFENVSQAVLDHENQEEAASGLDGLPDVVKAAAAASRMDVAEEAVSAAAPDPAMASFDEAMADAGAGIGGAAASAGTDSPEDEVEALSAIARALEDETGDEDAPPPAPSDIRALLLRVEALAKKAEGMRMAQRDSKAGDGPQEPPKQPPKQPPKRTGAAA